MMIQIILLKNYLYYRIIQSTLDSLNVHEIIIKSNLIYCQQLEMEYVFHYIHPHMSIQSLSI